MARVGVQGRGAPQVLCIETALEMRSRKPGFDPNELSLLMHEALDQLCLRHWDVSSAAQSLAPAPSNFSHHTVVTVPYYSRDSVRMTNPGPDWKAEGLLDERDHLLVQISLEEDSHHSQTLIGFSGCSAG